MEIRQTPTLIAFAALLNVCFAVGIILGSRFLGRRGSWLAWIGMLLLLTAFGIDNGFFGDGHFISSIYVTGFVGQRFEPGSLALGILHDTLGMTFGLLTALLATSVLFLHDRRFQSEVFASRLYASLLAGVSGVVLAWCALTPWLVLCGCMLSGGAAVLALGASWVDDQEADRAATFFSERGFGLLLSCLGMSFLASHGPSLFFQAASLRSLGIADLGGASSPIGLGFLLVGIFFQLAPFPLLSWSIGRSQLFSPTKALICQLIPAFSALALLFRFEDRFRELGVLFDLFGYGMIGSCFLALFSAFFQPTEWGALIGVWFRAALALVCAYVPLAGGLTAFAMLMGASSGLLVFSSAQAVFQVPQATRSLRLLGMKVVTFLGGASATGALGFYSSTAGLRVLDQSMAIPGLAAVLLGALFCYALLGWRITWLLVKSAKHSQTASQLGMNTLLASFLWVMLNVACVWTGSLTGGALLGDVDRLWTPLLAPESQDFGLENFLSISTAYWGAIFVAFLTAYWTVGRKEDVFAKAVSHMPQLRAFVAEGYGMSAVRSMIWSTCRMLGFGISHVLEVSVWRQALPQGLWCLVAGIAGAMHSAERSIGHGALRLVQSVSGTIGGLFQALHTGNIQWYLVVIIGFGACVLVHFLGNI